MARESEKIKQDLCSRYDFNAATIFKEVDDWNYKYIDGQNLKRFLIKTNIFPNDALLISIIRRVDLDADGKLNFKEFTEFILPVEDYSKRAKKEKINVSGGSKNKPKTASTVRSVSKSQKKLLTQSS
mmetsp:Transcript_43156/g.41506  ORF Transcript_43156/g.41506 Transcript_43156/m.41506 type:complete len:127 (+) Transcript_43156:449-829(+)|eukprot:CAMPEP_0170542612 /NCGR_PEP_ID=MMETSP0211-20121228/1985_1 /TAXON_ID=311385 /ORGANISM="Pseudokeronopsis sp., Strain OXSARD2" /LENGTH=126 /DNA_ID=CAMNT_0010845729 /DNA_START=406 /DNA_END=786 /DNA_ORIENTATION=-